MNERDRGIYGAFFSSLRSKSLILPVKRAGEAEERASAPCSMI
jgi:hypothetical protein